jgi:hypothetical protein
MLVAMRDTHPPSPPETWEETFIAKYPDGSTSDFDLMGYKLAVGDRVPGKNYVLERWEIAERPREDGTWMVIGILRESE